MNPRPAALGTVLLALLLGACGAPRSAGPGAELPTGAVTVGTCKLKTTAEEVVALSDTSPAVDCTTPHTLETYAVSRVEPRLAALGPERPPAEVLTVRNVDVCPLTVRDHLGADALDSQWGVSVFVKYPTRAEWRRGERTVLCDLVVGADPGVVPALDVPLAGALRFRDSARLRLCAHDGEPLTCDRPHTAERAGDVPVAAPGTDPAAEVRACAANGAAYTAGTPDAATAPRTWRPEVVHRDGAAQCWLTHDAPRTGTLRGGLVAR